MISKTGQRQLYLKGANLILEVGGVRSSLPYQDGWNVVYIEFSNVKEGINIFRLNKHFLIFEQLGEGKWDDEILVGGYKDLRLKAVIGRIAIYCEPQIAEENLPDKIRELYIRRLFSHKPLNRNVQSADRVLPTTDADHGFCG